MSEEFTQIYKIRHSLAHLLAAAVLEMYPDAKITLGPPVENGFYYDVDFGETKISDKELPKIQKRMKKILTTWEGFEKKIVTKNEALGLFKGNQYKEELINEIAERGEEVTLYESGKFTDLCRGGHVENMKAEVKPDMFKLERVAGAYWRGDENNTMLTRIYGVAFETADELVAYEEMVKQAKERDHRKIGKELDLFTFSELVGPGLPLFTPRGTVMRDLIVDKIHNIQKDFGYQKVTIPHLTKKDLYETSGHWDKFGDNLFHVTGKSDQKFVMKPMNCPHHTQIFASQPRSYKDLPVRYMESTMVYRDEQAGELLGLSRVRSITQDDGHVFCTPEQIEQEVKNIVHVIKEFYTSLDMLHDGNYWVSLSVSDPNEPEEYLGDKKQWEIAEEALEKIARDEGLNYKRVEGEAAFYGPKLDFQFKDALGREWQLGTAQLDFQMPTRFGLEYTDADGSKKTPVMIHRAVAGSLERFLSVAIEHFAGHFPVWLAPTQATIVPVNVEAHGEYGHEVFNKLKAVGIRAEIEDGKDSLGKRIRKAKTMKIPYVVVLGDNEKSGQSLTVELRDDSKLEGISVDDFIKRIQDES